MRAIFFPIADTHSPTSQMTVGINTTGKSEVVQRSVTSRKMRQQTCSSIGRDLELVHGGNQGEIRIILIAAL
ncbi:hypothetical protein [Sinorhizobium sp. Sb3]|uniref:hypothetical protein n=1 Tax=Sinorhizobium/Ensifer group TaxID=227292 RepID=UPI001FDAB4E3|nr:hypothetical protein [Sinorhizobium sp. Sb3]